MNDQFRAILDIWPSEESQVNEIFGDAPNQFNYTVFTRRPSELEVDVLDPQTVISLKQGLDCQILDMSQIQILNGKFNLKQNFICFIKVSLFLFLIMLKTATTHTPAFLF